MSLDRIEILKSQYTDKFVVVNQSAPELRRFVGLTGTVKTVNMNGRALVQFDGPVDISWYDIDPGYLTVIKEPLPKKAEPTEKKAPSKEAPKAAPTVSKPTPAVAKPAATTAPVSKIDQIRQGTKPADGGGGGESKADLIRKQMAGAKPVAPAKEVEAPPTSEVVTEKPAPVAESKPVDAKSATATADTSGLSKIELIRRQMAEKKS